MKNFKKSITHLTMIFMLTSLVLSCVGASQASKKAECFGIFEISMKGPKDGNPFLDVQLSAQFKQKDRIIKVRGFYDGSGIYRIRFMPDIEGNWTYQTKSNRRELDNKTGKFTCIKASKGNHGPVRVQNTYHFAYADGTFYFPIGTTCYAWVHQGKKLEEQTLTTLRNAPFNKIRMCAFPKDYIYNKNEPEYYPFEGKPLKEWDFTRFNPEFFQHLEKRIGDLRDLGIQADIILFHPYDRWGFKDMGYENNVRYLKYLIARLAAYRNVWWSLANEFDLLDWPMSDWDKYFQLIRDEDPYNHPRSVHNCVVWYDHTKPWVTHASLQTAAMESGDEFRKKYKKPVIFDEVQYEGNIEMPWGNITARELVRRFWIGTVCGCYVTHGETYEDPNDILWWSKGGILHGESPKRIAFLKRILSESPPGGIDPIKGDWAWQNSVAGKEGEYYLFYFGVHQPSYWTLPSKGENYQIDVLDTWNMTITPIGTYKAGSRVKLPGKPYIALRIRKIR